MHSLARVPAVTRTVSVALPGALRSVGSENRVHLVNFVLEGLLLVGSGTDTDVGLNADDAVGVEEGVGLADEAQDGVPGTFCGDVSCKLGKIVRQARA